MEDAAQLTSKQRYRKRFDALVAERSSWIPHYRELSDFIQPRRSRFLSTDTNRGTSTQNDEIINGTATWACRVLSSGMMAGITSPARDWFRLTTPDPELAEFGSVKDWLHIVEMRLKLAFQRSNIYNALHVVYQDLAWAGTAVLHCAEDLDDGGLRNFVYPVGSFCLANSAKLKVDSVYREFGMSVAQLVEEFTLAKCSPMVQAQFRQGSLDAWIQVIHAIQPNVNRISGQMGPRGMPFASVYFERDAGDEGLLRNMGYEELPTMCPRWAVTGEDVYGSSPAMEALGDVKALQELEKKAGQAFDKIVNPPMRAPMSMMTQAVSLLPGATNYVEHVQPGQAFAPAYELRPESITVVENKIRQHEMRIKTALYADLFLMLAQGEGGAMTAKEVAAREGEKLLQLGPVMERLQDDLLDPLIRRAFGILWRGHYLPPPPPELQGAELRVEYISTMAQAQKMLGSGSVERLTAFVGNLTAVYPDVADKLDSDQLVDEYGSMLGVPPRIIRTADQVAQLRAQKAQAQQAAQQQQALAASVQGAQVMSQTDMSGDTALSRAVQQFGPAAGAGGGGRTQ